MYLHAHDTEKLQISEINSDQGQISKKICNFSGNEFPTFFFGFCTLGGAWITFVIPKTNKSVSVSVIF